MCYVVSKRPRGSETLRNASQSRRRQREPQSQWPARSWLRDEELKMDQSHMAAKSVLLSAQRNTGILHNQSSNVFHIWAKSRLQAQLRHVMLKLAPPRVTRIRRKPLSAHTRGPRRRPRLITISALPGFPKSKLRSSETARVQECINGETINPIVRTS